MSTCSGCGTDSGCHASNCPVRYQTPSMSEDLGRQLLHYVTKANDFEAENRKLRTQIRELQAEIARLNGCF